MSSCAIFPGSRSRRRQVPFSGCVRDDRVRPWLRGRDDGPGVRPRQPRRGLVHRKRRRQLRWSPSGDDQPPGLAEKDGSCRRFHVPGQSSRLQRRPDCGRPVRSSRRRPIPRGRRRPSSAGARSTGRPQATAIFAEGGTSGTTVGHYQPWEHALLHGTKLPWQWRNKSTSQP